MKTGCNRCVDIAWVLNAMAAVLAIAAHRSWILADNYSRLSISSAISRTGGKTAEPVFEHAESVLYTATQDFGIMIVASTLLGATAILVGLRPVPRVVGACVSVLALFMGLSYYR